MVILNAVKNLVVHLRPFALLRVTPYGHSERSEESRCLSEILSFAQGDGSFSDPQIRYCSIGKINGNVKRKMLKSSNTKSDNNQNHITSPPPLSDRLVHSSIPGL